MKNKTSDELLSARRTEIKTMFQEFMDGPGRLPKGFSEPYNKHSSSGYTYCVTPFSSYLDEISSKVDSLNDRSGISDWLFFDGSAEINAAVWTISGWAKLQRQETELLHQKCHVGNTSIPLTVPTHCGGKTMIVTQDGSAFENLTEDSRQICREENISFCILLSDRKLYDLIEQKEMEINYVTYPNYHDETYADWWLGQAE